jgi:glycerol-3-phosphate dehydrogenase
VKSRQEALRKIENTAFDVCVIGGGASGAGSALDAQLRGLTTVLVDAGDFAGATSSAATKIIHGGVRYLQDAVKHLDIHQYQVVKKALCERIRMLHNAPFLTRTLEFVVPCFSWFDVVYYGIGLKMYDWIAGDASLFPSRYISRQETIKRFPSLKTAGLRGAIVYADGQFDDSRYDIALIRTFTESGGEALNYAKVSGFLTGRNGKIAAAEVQDQVTGSAFTIRARAFVNATGPFSDTVRTLAHAGVPPRMRPSKGVHIFLPLDGFSDREALLIPKTEDGRLIFALPWLGRLLVGTTDHEVGVQEEMILKRAEAEYLLRHVNPYLKRPFSVHDIQSGIAGMRPLVGSRGKKETKSLVRDDEVEVDASSGLISILGGKWTTHRAMAEGTINAVEKYLNGTVTPSLTPDHPLSGAEGYDKNYAQRLASEFHIPADTARHLAEKFGTVADKVLAPTVNNPRLLLRVVPGFPAIMAEVLYSIRHEMAVSIEDILARRTGLQLFSWEDALTVAPKVAQCLADELSWSQLQKQEAVNEYTNKIHRFLEVAGISAGPSEEDSGLSTSGTKGFLEVRRS